MKNKTKVLLSSLAAIAMSASLAAGATYALFTSEDRVNIAVTSGKVKINANVDVNSMEMWSRNVTGLTGTWVNGGTADLTEEDVTLELITPGDGISFNIDVTNESNVAIQYRTVVACETGAALYEGLKVSLDYLGDTQADAQEFDGVTAYGAWTALAGGVGTVDTVKVTIEFPYLDTDQNKYQDLATTIYFRVEAVQGNADVTDQTPVQGQAIVNTATDVELISRKVANGYDFAGETVTLGGDIDLAAVSTFAAELKSNWLPMGTEETPFAGTFDGNGYTISNLVLADETYAGFFGFLGSNATVKNVKFENVNVNGKYAATAVAYVPETSENVTIENIEVLSGAVNATSYAAGVVGIVEGKNATISNCVNYAEVVSDYSASGVGAWLTGENFVIKNCVNNGNVTGANRAAGIAGNLLGTISYCENNGAVVGNGNMPAGGIVAVQSGASTYEYCVNNGDVKTTSDNPNASASGILGHTPSTKATIQYCVNNGKITAEKDRASGIAYGLYGNVNAYYCYNTGVIVGEEAAAGIIAKNAYGTTEAAYNCLNAGAVTATLANQITVKNQTACYYYDAGVLYAANDTAAVVDEALTALNDGAAVEFFAVENGVIVGKIA